MAATYAFEGQPTAFYNSMFLNCLNGILRASGRVPARCGEKRRYAVAIKIYREQDNKLEYFLHGWIESVYY
jgi:hypothetical protein